MKNKHLRLLWLNPYYRLALLILILAGTLSLTIYTVKYYPLNKRFTHAKYEKDKIRDEISRVLKLNAIAISYKSTVKKVEALEEKLSTSYTQSEITRQVSKLARKAGLQIKSESDELQTRQTTPARNLKKLSIIGSYKSIRAFIAGINKLDLLITVDELALKRKTNGSLSGTITLAHNIKAELTHEK